MSEGHFRCEREGGIATLILDRADKRNALTRATLSQLEQLAYGFRDEADTRVVVIRAEGDHFSVGADLGEMPGKVPSLVQMRRVAEQGARLMRALREIHQPTICAIQGISTGGATCIASACDFRVVSDEARIGYGEVKLGINLMWNALPPIIALVGPARAKSLVMSGDLIDARILEKWGFVDMLVKRKSLENEAQRLAEKYAALPPVAVQMIKRSVNALASPLGEAIMHADADQWLLATQSADFQEGIAAFRDKRAPKFTGK